MIEYVEIKNADRVTVGIIDTAKSIIWHSIYFGVGDFEIYAQADEHNMSLLKKGYFVTRPNNDEVGIIEGVTVEFNLNDGYMITAVGRFAKILLDRRIIYKLSGNTLTPTILRGNVEIAVRQTVLDNAINCRFDSRRNIPMLGLAGLNNYTPVIVDENGKAAQKQVSHKNLMEYTDSVLQEYGLGALVIYNDSNKMLLYRVIQGADRSIGNTAGNEQIIFSVEYDNLNSSKYDLNDTDYRNAALVGGEGEGLDRYYSLLRGAQSGLQLREIFVDAASQNRTLKASELSETYPAGTFNGLNFVVDGTVYATLVLKLDTEYSLSTLQDKFPSGTVSGTKFVVNGTTYATAVYGKENTYTLTALGYKAMLDINDDDGDYMLSNSIYTSILNQQGKVELSQHIVNETFSGAINATFGVWQYGRDYFLGDIVTVQDNVVGEYINSRITEVTEVQDENGYTVDVVFGE